MACEGVMGRMETTSGPAKGPAGWQGTVVRYMGTLRPCSMWRTGRPAARSAASNEKLQPSRKATASAGQWLNSEVGSSATRPSRQMR